MKISDIPTPKELKSSRLNSIDQNALDMIEKLNIIERIGEINDDFVKQNNVSYIVYCQTHDEEAVYDKLCDIFKEKGFKVVADKEEIEENESFDCDELEVYLKIEITISW